MDESLDSIVRRFGDFFLNIALKSFQPLPKGMIKTIYVKLMENNSIM